MSVSGMSLRSSSPISFSSASTSRVHFHDDLHEHEEINVNEDRGVSQRKKNNNSTPDELSARRDDADAAAASFAASAVYEQQQQNAAAAKPLSPATALLMTQHTSSYSNSSLGTSAASSTPNTPLRIGVSAEGAPLVRRHKRRLPQSGLTLCGRRWLLGAEDMCLPACWSAQFDMFLVALSIASWRYVYTSDYPESCSAEQKRQLETYIVLHAVGYVTLLGLDIATIISSLYSNMFKRNTTIVKIIYARLFTTLCVIIVTVLANIAYFDYLRSACSPPDGTEGGNALILHRLVVVLFLASLSSFLVFGSYFICSYGFGPLCGKGTMASWGKHIQRWLLCYTPTTSSNGRNVLESIAWIFTEFFAADRAIHDGEPIHIVPSDVLVGFALVEASQVRRVVEGYNFLKSAPKNRWDKDAFQPHVLGDVSQADVDLHDTFQQSYVAGHHHAKPSSSATVASSGSSSVGSSGSSPSPDPLAAAQKGLLETARALAEKEHVLPHEQPDAMLAMSAGHGEQPPLDPRDWQRIADAKHFAKYAMGSYGWLLYAFNNLGCFFTCKACRCCTPNEYDPANMIGSGCGPCTLCGIDRRCCHWSVSSFLLTTGIADTDILYAHLDSAPIYYLVVDHKQKCVVVCCRGTLSVADAVIDLDAQLSPLDPYGYKGGYTHTGILENALRLRDDLDEKGHLAAFLQRNPSYNVTVVGHSLGAATASLLTLLLRDRFDQGPPAVTTAGALTPNTRNKLTCIAYGCPLLVDLSVAHSEFALRCITTVVNNSDIISRLSLATCSLLKDQMIQCFAVSSSSKFRILSNSLRKNYEESFETGINMHQVASPLAVAAANNQQMLLNSPDDAGVSEEMLLGRVSQAMNSLEILPENKSDRKSGAYDGQSSPDAASHGIMVNESLDDSDHKSMFGTTSNAFDAPLLESNSRPVARLSPLQPVQTSGSSSSTPAANSHAPGATIPAVVVTAQPKGAAASSSSSSASPTSPSSAEFTMHLRKCYLPGRIYHLLPGQRDKTKAQFFGLKKAPRGTVVYPSAQDTFQEIVVTKMMFNDHLPEKYEMNFINIPKQFEEPTDMDSSPSPASSASSSRPQEIAMV